MKTNKNFSRMMQMALLLSAFLMMAGATFAAPKETDPIWRVQLRVQVADVKDAGTDDSVRMALNSMNNTWLDYGRDDFERNSNFIYDLKLTHVATIADLSHIYLEKTGSDGLALKAITLIVNGRSIYTQTFATPFWMDNSGGRANRFVVDYSQLRQDDAWQAYYQPLPPFFISRDEIESRIESTIGDSIKGNKLYWGHLYGRAVEVTKKANAVNTLHVDLDLAYDVIGFDPEVDVDFDLEIRCTYYIQTNTRQITLEVKNMKVVVDSAWYAEVFSLGLYQLADFLANQLLPKPALNSLAGVNVSICPTITVNNDGSIIFSLPTPTPRVISPITTFPPTTIGFSKVSTEFSATSETADGDAPLSVTIETDDSFDVHEATPYTLVVKSQWQEARQINFSIALPANISANDGLVEITDANGMRTLAAIFSTGANGEAVLNFTDTLAAGAEQRYQLSFRFLSGATAEMKLVATVSDAAGVTLDSSTFFQLNEGVVKARGTFQATKGLATEKTQVHEIR